LGALTAWAGTVTFEVLSSARRHAAPAAPTPANAPSAEEPALEAPAPAEAAATAPAATPQPLPETARELGACVQRAFAPGTFPEGWSADVPFVCDEPDPRRGAHFLRAELIRAGGKRHVTAGMREWSMLGWYNMAAFAAVRGQCCPQPAPLRAPGAGNCPDLTQPLNALVDVVGGRRPRDAQRLALIRESYRSAVQCLDRAGFQGYFDQWGALHGGEDATFDQFFARLVEGATAPPATSASTTPLGPAPAPSDLLFPPASYGDERPVRHSPAANARRPRPTGPTARWPGVEGRARQDFYVISDL
jgi:hypothetical protein